MTFIYPWGKTNIVYDTSYEYACKKCVNWSRFGLDFDRIKKPNIYIYGAWRPQRDYNNFIDEAILQCLFFTGWYVDKLGELKKYFTKNLRIYEFCV